MTAKTTRKIDFWAVRDMYEIYFNETNDDLTPVFTEPSDLSEESECLHFQAIIPNKYQFTTNDKGEDIIKDLKHPRAFVEANINIDTCVLTFQAFYDGLNDDEAEPEEAYSAVRID